MTNQEKIGFLKRAKWIDAEIDRKQKELDEWRVRLQKVTSAPSPVPKGGGTIHSRIPDIIAIIVDMESDINREIDKLVKAKAEIRRKIEQVEDDRERLLLQYRYLDGLSWERVAVEMNYSWQHMHRLHSQALVSLK